MAADLALTWEGFHPRQQDKLEPVIHDAFSAAEAYLQTQRIDPSQADTVTVKKMDVSGVAAEVEGKDMRLFIDQQDLRQFRLNKRQVGAYISKTIVHELVHMARDEALDYDNHPDIFEFWVLDYAAHEGLAYSVESAYGRVIKYPKMEVADHLVKSHRGAQATRLMFNRRFNTGGWQDELQEPIFEELFGGSESIASNKLPVGLLFGVKCVQERIKEGASFGELITMPTKDILDVRA